MVDTRHEEKRDNIDNSCVWCLKMEWIEVLLIEMKGNMCIYLEHIFPFLCIKEIVVPSHLPCGRARLMPRQQVSITKKGPGRRRDVCSCQDGVSMTVVECPLTLGEAPELKSTQLHSRRALH